MARFLHHRPALPAVLSTLSRTVSRTVVALAVVALAVVAAAGCSGNYESFDSAGYLRDVYQERLDPETLAKAEIEVPFELDEQVLQAAHTFMRPSTSPYDHERKVEEVQSFIFRRLDLQYSLSPTRNAVETFHAREGNCLSYVNLFIGVAREMRLNPFYVEVTDYNRWNYRNGMVVSQGHIVAGIRTIDGKLTTHDFLPYRPKTYREFKPIDDATAAAHYYNNLAAEELMAGNGDRALEMVRIATRIAPDFEKALNNLGVALARRGDLEEALEVYRHGIEVDPTNVAILTNMVRAYQQLGKADDASEILAQLEGYRHTNPYFFVYQGELALANGEPERALEYLQQAFRRDSELPEVHLGLAKTYLDLGELPKARHHVGRCLRLDATYQECLKFAELLQ